jgi:hypothetical protein
MYYYSSSPPSPLNLQLEILKLRLSSPKAICYKATYLVASKCKVY